MVSQTNFTNNQKEKINIFISLAINFNKTHNIFSRKSPEEVMKKDILDCAPIINIKPLMIDLMEVAQAWS